MELDSRGQHRTVASSEHRNHFVFLLKASPAEIARTHRTREEFVPHCSENWRRGLQWEQWAVVRLMWEELLRHGMSPGEIRACYRLYAAHRRSHRPAVVGHFGHLRKMLASFAAQLFSRGALVER
jgi:hypothetical protein